MKQENSNQPKTVDFFQITPTTSSYVMENLEFTPSAGIFRNWMVFDKLNPEKGAVPLDLLKTEDLKNFREILEMGIGPAELLLAITKALKDRESNPKKEFTLGVYTFKQQESGEWMYVLEGRDEIHSLNELRLEALSFILKQSPSPWMPNDLYEKLRENRSAKQEVRVRENEKFMNRVMTIQREERSKLDPSDDFVKLSNRNSVFFEITDKMEFREDGRRYSFLGYYLVVNDLALGKKKPWLLVENKSLAPKEVLFQLDLDRHPDAVSFSTFDEVIEAIISRW